MTGLIVLVFVGSVVVWVIVGYNRLIGMQEPGAERVAANRRSAEAATRSDPEPGQRRAWIDGLRARHAHRRHGSAREGADGDRTGRCGTEGRTAVSRRSVVCWRWRKTTRRSSPTTTSRCFRRSCRAPRTRSASHGSSTTTSRRSSTPRSRCFRPTCSQARSASSRRSFSRLPTRRIVKCRQSTCRDAGRLDYYVTPHQATVSGPWQPR